MGEIRIVSPGKTHGYPYPVCKNYGLLLALQTAKKFVCKIEATFCFYALDLI